MSRNVFLKAFGMRRGVGLAAMLAALVVLGGATPAPADGILIPERPDAPNFAVKYHRVDVTIEGQAATTKIDQVFENRSGREQEAVYVFPLPHGASVREFTLYDQGQPLHAELLNRDKAREIYESIVRKRRDPALLEYVGRDTYRVRVFPIPAHGTKRIQMEYTELLAYDSGVVSYVYPLSTEKFSSAPIEEVRVAIKVESRTPIRAVYSPTHEMQVDKADAHTAFATLEEHGTRPSLDLVLHYTVSEKDVGTSVLTYKESGEDGFFLVMAAPSPQLARKDVQPKDVAFVLDQSGSMSGEKIEQAKGALAFCLNSLNENDRFRIITFSNTVRVHGVGNRLKPASRENVREARKLVEDMTAGGGTDIHSALDTALGMDFDDKRASYVVFLTDGLPTVGQTDIGTIAKDVEKWNAQGGDRRARLFVFGAGYDVNTIFLEQLAQNNGGVTEYVRPKEDIEVKVSRFFAKVAQPVLTRVALDVAEVETYDVFPAEMPDLFAGSQLLVFGRYRAEKPVMAKVSLTGYASPERKRFATSVRFPTSQREHDYIAPLWASRKIGWLLDQIMVHGEEKELVDEVIALSTRYGILTEYTAFLAEEGSRIEFEEARSITMSNVDAGLKGPAGAAGPAGPVGSWATSQRQNAQMLRSQSNLAAQNVQLDRAGDAFRYEQAQTRNNQAFFNRGGNWEDARYKEGVQQVVQVKAYSEAYFQLTRRRPELNQYFSQGPRVLVVTNGQAIQIGDEGKDVFTEQELDELLGDRHASSVGDDAAEPTDDAVALASHAPRATAVGILMLLLGCALAGLCHRSTGTRRGV
ncbi:MAG: VWA domain-containing protein [Armatimonadota bacterium]|nr:MAG: VWA domain-containing protein [Armatimonadota bacterium]